MRDLITADWHLSDNPRDAYRFSFLEQRLPKLIRHYNVTRLYLLGDLTEAKDHHGSHLVNRIIDGLVRLSDRSTVRIMLLCGNHDYETDMEHPFFGFTGYIDGLHYIHQPTRDGTDLLLPHTRDPATAWDKLDLRDVKMILAHATFSGAVGSNRVPLAGTPPPSTSIPIVSGDVHVPQRVGNVTYVGAPYSVDFGDGYQPRVLLRHDGKLTTIKLKGPQKRIIDWPNREHAAQPGDIVRIQVKLKRADYDRWAELREQARTWGVDAGLVVESVVPVITPAHGTPVERALRGPQSDQQTLKNYCDKFQIDKPTAQQGEELL
jgi:hypothetical protein